MEAAEAALRSVSTCNKITMKLSSSAGARKTSTRNSNCGYAKESSFRWINPTVEPHHRKLYCCVYHPREQSGQKRKRETQSKDKNCLFKATILCYPHRASLSDEPSYEYRLAFQPHRVNGELLYPNGHGHDTDETAEAQKAMPQNSKLTQSEKDIIAAQAAATTGNMIIQTLLGGPEAEDGRQRTTKAISNEKQRVRRLLKDAKHSREEATN